MKVKIYDKEHEKDLEEEINRFLEKPGIDVIDIKYSTSIMYDGRNQIFCYSALIIYE